MICPNSVIKRTIKLYNDFKSIYVNGEFQLIFEKPDVFALSYNLDKIDPNTHTRARCKYTPHYRNKRAIIYNHCFWRLSDNSELAKSSMFMNKRVCEILRDRFEISYADSTLKSKASKALQSIANEFGENILYDKQFVEGVLRKVPYYTQRTVDILTQRLEYDCAYLRQF